MLTGHQNRIRYFVIGILLPIVLALPQLLIAGHNPLAFYEMESQRHQQLAPVAGDSSAHSHDSGDPYEQQTSHFHGHNPADHSHGSALHALQPQVVVIPGRHCPAAYYYSCTPFHAEPPDRPPRLKRHA